jgi:uncharacterized surface anchored protein
MKWSFISIIVIAMLLLFGCTGPNKSIINEDIKKQIVADITNPDCLIGFELGTKVGANESVEDKALKEAMLKIINPTDEAYKRCYKWGLIAKANSDWVDVIRTGVRLVR